MRIEECYSALGHCGVILFLGLAGSLAFRRSFRPSWLFGALVFYLVYDFALSRFYRLVPNLPEGSDWNWTGKAMGIAATLALASLPFVGWRRAGLTWRQAKGSWTAWVVFGVLTAALFMAAALDGAGPADAETIAFQWTMPGLDEEPFYRGVLLLALNEAFTARRRVLGAPVGYGGVLSCVLFGIIHAMSYGDGGYAFDAMTFAVTGIPAAILLWMRERTGSVVLPVLAHNVANGAFNVV